MKRIGIVGCGSIGSFIAKRVDADLKGTAKLSGLCDIDYKKAKLLSGRLSKKPPMLSLERLISASDIIIEAASGKVSADICKKTLLKGKDIMIMSIGGLLGKDELFLLAKKRNARIILPSGAICGLDGLKSAASGRIKKVTLTTRKPPQSLKGAPYIIEKNIQLDSITEECLVFEGTADEAVRGFPQNVNVSALLSIAGIGPKKTIVKIVTSPQYLVNTHEIEVEGDFGRFITRTENVPFPENPKTSFLAALSALSTLKGLLDETKMIGT
jgi:aspartate dehydrogenase